MDVVTPLDKISPRTTARALLVGNRVDTVGLEHNRVLSTNPLTVPAGANGIATLFRYGVVVMVGMTPAEQNEFIDSIRPRIKGPVVVREEETATIEVAADADDYIVPGGPIGIKTISPERLLVIADALAKSVVLANDEREVATVFDVIEPFATGLAENGRSPAGRREMLRHIGKVLLVQHRVSGHAAVAEKPDALWDRPDLERLYSRLEDEYELNERVNSLNRKLAVITDTAQALTDIIDTERSLRLEFIIVVLIVFEIVITIYQIISGK